MRRVDRNIWREKKGRYRVRLAAVDPRTGKQREVNRVVIGSLSDARREREQLRGGIHAGDDERARLTLGEYAKRWTEARSPRLKPSTRERYKDAMRLHIMPAFGDRYLDAVQKVDVDAWAARAVTRTRARGRAPYRPQTVNGWLRILQTIYRDAAADLGIPNPLARLAPLPTTTVEDRREALTAPQVTLLLEHVREEEPEAYPLLLTLVLTGMRWGEATALQWGDIGDGVIVCKRAHVRGTVATPKTGPKVYPLPAVLEAALQAHRRELVADQHPGLRRGWVFATRSARDEDRWRLRFPSSFQKALPRWCAACGIEKHITPHSLRRTAVDLLRAAGVDLVVRQALIGHATGSMTAHYSTVRHEEKEEAAARVVRLVGGER